MGIERFFNSLMKNGNLEHNDNIIDEKNKLNIDYLYIDFNSIVCNISYEIEKELNYILYSIILEKNNNIQYDEETVKYMNKWNINNVSLENYKTVFNNNKIDDEAIYRIKQYIYDFTEKYIMTNNLKTIFISIDGIPHMGKIVEQRKRKYNNYIITKIKSHIYENEKSKLSENRILYEENKIANGNNKLLSWDKFNTDILDSIKSNDFKNNLLKINKNIKNIIISDGENHGEGEKKIMQHIIDNNMKGFYGIISPDSDTIILGMITLNILNNNSSIDIIRPNNCKEYIYVNINKLCDNLYDHLCNIGRLNKQLYNKNDIINDISFMFTLFGNDFIPKLESIDIRNDIDTLMIAYCNCMRKTKKKYLIFREKNMFKINYNNFYDFIQNISKHEDMLLADTYMSNRYRNYSFYKKELNVDRLYPVIYDYIDKANYVFNMLRELVSCETYDVDNIVNIYKNDIIFMRNFLIFESNKKHMDITNVNVVELFKQHLISMISFEDKTKIKIQGKFKLYTYDNNNIETEHNYKLIRDNLAHSKMEISDYDKELFKFDKKMDPYVNMINGHDFNLGNIEIIITQNGDYKILQQSAIVNVIDYYKTFFNINNYDMTTKQYYSDESDNDRNNEYTRNSIVFDSEMDNLVDEYIKGIFWIFDWYFNKNNSVSTGSYISSWFYPYNRSPLLFQVRNILNKYRKIGTINYIDKMNMLFNEVTFSNKYRVSKANYMNKTEHYMYITPVNKHYGILDKYLHIIKNNPNIFPDLNMIVKKLISGSCDVISEVIDCRRIQYVSKCNLHCINNISYDDYIYRIRWMVQNNIDKKYKNINDYKINNKINNKVYKVCY